MNCPSCGKNTFNQDSDKLICLACGWREGDAAQREREAGSYKDARGVFGWQEGDEPAEDTIRRLRDNDAPTHMPHSDEPVSDNWFDYDDDDGSDFEDNETRCPVCGSDDLNLKWYFFDDDTQQTVGRLMECEDCGTQFNDWYPRSDA